MRAVRYGGTSRRRGVVSGAAAFAAMVALASVAWACTAHTGETWFCGTSTTPRCSSTTTQSFTAGATVYSQANDLSRCISGVCENRAYTLRYANGFNQDTACMTSTTNFGTNFTTNSFGDWSNQAVTMPAKADYTLCATMNDDANQASYHTNFSAV